MATKVQTEIPHEEEYHPDFDSLSKDDKNLGMLTHLLGLLTSFIGPLILWLMKKDESEYIEANSREALNFQISMLIYFTVSSILTVVFIGVIFLHHPRRPQKKSRRRRF